jgi:hypothetical protein
VTTDAHRALARRKLAELHAKLDGIALEFDRWRADAERGRPLRKHQKQICRLTDQLRGVADDVGQRVAALSLDDDDVLIKSRELQTRMLEVHRLWDYFRSKLNLRYVDWISGYLATADEFAWACYEPAEKATGKRALPRCAPLVFLTGEFSPFTYARGASFEVEDLPNTVDSDAFRSFVAAMPIPVVGVPWYQVALLPDAVIIAHEVGHDVERDFELTATIRSQLEVGIAGLADERDRFAWESWIGEVWADVYGVLAAGPAFVSAMTDLLVGDPRLITLDARAPSPFSDHPPASLRVEIMTRTLAATGFQAEADRQRDAWSETFGASDGSPVFAAAQPVVDALLTGSFPEFGGRTLREVLSFSARQQEFAVGVKGRALADVVPQTADIRCLVAGARLAFDADPVRYGEKDEHRAGAQQRILEQAQRTIGDAPRFREEEQFVTPEEDRAAGLAIFERLLATASP